MTDLTRAQAFTFASGLSRFGARRQLASRTQSFLVGCLLGILIAWLLIATVTANAADYKAGLEQVLVTAATREDRSGHSVIGKSFDVVAILSVQPPHTSGAIHGPTGPFGRLGARVELDALSDEQREFIFDQCSPTPCTARLILTLLPEKTSDNIPRFRLDGWK